MNLFQLRSAVAILPLLLFLARAKNPTASSSSSTKSASSFSIRTRVVNAFPPSGEDNSKVTLYLDEDKIQGVGYGKFAEKETTLLKVEDFVIDFKHPTTGAVVHGPANYGYIQRDVGMGDELLVIVRRNKRNSQKPTSDIFKFPPLAKEATSAVSKVFLYNAVLSVDPMLQGMNYYQFHERTGVLSILAVGLLMGKGAEILIPSGKTVTIKASHANLKASHEHQLAHITTVKFLPVPGGRQYLVVMGDRKTENIQTIIIGASPAPQKSSGDTSHTHLLLLLTILLFTLVAQ